LISENESLVNAMNCMCYDRPLDLEIVRTKMRKQFKTKPKFLYKMVEIFGDYYYAKMDEEEVFSKALVFMDGVVNNKEEIDQFI
jgi:hypothetical protein